MKTTSNLSQDHRYILEMLDVMKIIAASIDKTKKAVPGQIEEILDFLKNFADVNHHGKEEQLLFPAMGKKGIPENGGPIGVMLSEHSLGRKYIAAMSESLNSYRAGNEDATSSLVENIFGYVELLAAHISKEDNILFPMADRLFSESEDTELFSKFESVEKGSISAEKRISYLSLAGRLRNTYK